MADSTTSATDSGSQSTNAPPVLSYEDIIQASISNVSTQPPISNGVATPETIIAVVNDLLVEHKMSTSVTNQNKAKLTIAALAQMGAASPRFTESKNFGSFGCNFSVSSLRKASKKYSTTIRALARGLRSEAIKVAEAFHIEGNLSKSYKLEYPTAQFADLIWVSDFQSFSDDPAMPEDVRHWLLKNYANRFGAKKTL
jgi:hypothetical protein